MRYVTAALITGLFALAAIWAFNKFSGKNVSQLGAGA